MVDAKDRKLMQLAHYFITVKNYTPMVVRGVQNELWLENLEEPYKVIRINANYIHNNEQLNYDLFKVKNITKQVAKKTLSFHIPTLNILLNVGSNAEVHDTKDICSVNITEEESVFDVGKLKNLYTDFSEKVLEDDNSLNFIVDVTKDINEKANKDNEEVEKIFRKKKIVVTYILIALNILIFIVGNIGLYTESYDLFSYTALLRYYVQNGELYRLITASFTHIDFIHLATNMYSLYILGTEAENYICKFKFATVYLLSAISGSLLSCVVNNGWSVGASGAIFGIMGCLLYFGLHYRLYLDKALKTQIIPLIILNLTLGFFNSGIDNSAHIGGLIGGFFATMLVGINNKKKDNIDIINGGICYFLLIAALSYILFYI